MIILICGIIVVLATIGLASYWRERHQIISPSYHMQSTSTQDGWSKKPVQHGPVTVSQWEKELSQR